MADSAKEKLAMMPASAPALAIDAHRWAEAHERMIYGFATTATRAALSHDRNLRDDAERALGALLEHARLVLGDAAPMVLTKDGKHTVPYKELADLRAQVRVLKAELATRRALRPTNMAKP